MGPQSSAVSREGTIESWDFAREGAFKTLDF
jgi:hypothetical protein